MQPLITLGLSYRLLYFAILFHSHEIALGASVTRNTSSVLPYELLSIECLTDTVSARSIVQNRLVDKEVSVTHAWHFLHKVDRIELHVVVSLVNRFTFCSLAANTTE